MGFVGGEIVREYMQKSKSKKYYLPASGDIFEDLIVSDSVLTTLKLIIDQLQNPQKYNKSHIKPIKGALLYGTPGTGKTLIARVSKLLSYLCNLTITL